MAWGYSTLPLRACLPPPGAAVSALDLELVRRFLALHPPPGELLMCAITGSHNYGFSSVNSDIDIKGIHQAPTPRVLSLWPGRENHDRLEFFEGVECDLTTNELAQALRLVLKGNGNVLERIFSPLQVIDSPFLKELRILTSASLSRACYGHYRGYLRGMQREHERDGRAKSLLYSFRVALTGTHLLRAGEVVANLAVLAPEYGFSDLLELIAFKRDSDEKDGAPPALAAALRGRWPELEQLLDQARDNSALPERAPNGEAIDAWLVARRLDGCGGGAPRL